MPMSGRLTLELWEAAAVVTAVHFYATADDQERLLDYLGEPAEVTLHPWPLLASPPVVLSRATALSSAQVLVLSHALGPAVVVREWDSALAGSSRAGVFNRLNWERLKPKSTEGIVDSNISPVLLWTPATQGQEGLASGTLGSQADSVGAVSKDYERWVRRAMDWVRRQGTQVWGLEAKHQRSDLDLRRTDVTTVYALPGALRFLQDGTTGR